MVACLSPPGIIIFMISHLQRMRLREGKLVLRVTQLLHSGTGIAGVSMPKSRLKSVP